MSDTPFLTVGIPTFNRADRLRVTLEALLPQVAAHAPEVELWVSDNASPDHTREVVAAAEPAGVVRYHRNDTNIDGIPNFVQTATRLARGRYLWLMGDDDLLLPGALDRVLSTLQAQDGLASIYCNFRIATYPDHWPDSAPGGWDGPFERLANADTGDRPLARWADTIRSESSFSTQVYAHVVRRQIWVDYWRDRPIGELYSHPRWTWPHTYMLLETIFDEPCHYLGEPVLTIYSAGSSWHSEEAWVTLAVLPRLISDLEARGLPKRELREYLSRRFWGSLPHLKRMVGPERHGFEPSVATYLRRNWTRPFAWKALLYALADTHHQRWWGRALLALAHRHR